MKDNSKASRAYRREGAEARTEARAKRTAEQQIALLDERPGNSKRERARLAV